MRIQLTMRSFCLAALLSLLSGALLFARQSSAQELRLQYGDRVEGEMSAGAADVWRFNGGAGDRVTVQLERLEGEWASALTVRDPQNQVLLDVAWPAAEAPTSEVTLRLATGGEHSLEVRDRSGGAGRYALRLILMQAGAPAGSLDAALSYGQSVEGTLTEAAPEAAWSFRGEMSDVIDVTVTPEDGAFQPFVTLISPTGSAVASGAALSAARLPMAGIYTLDVRAVGSGVGPYRLGLRLRSSPTADTSFMFAPLEAGVPVRGTLTSDAPSARYRVDSGGPLALALDLSDPQARVAVAVLTENRAVLDHFAGIGQVRAVLAPGRAAPVWLELTSSDVRSDRPLNFEVQVSPLRFADREARALTFDRVRWVTPAPDPDVWFFDACAGDLITLSLQPEVLSSDGFVQLYGPARDLLLQRRVGSGFEQQLLLERAGVYELLIRTIGTESYRIGLTRQGAGGVPYDLIVNRVERGPLSAMPGLVASGELGARSGEVWTLDINEAGAWLFELSAPSSAEPLALQVQAPDGNTLAERLSLPVSGRAAVRLQLEAPGRYRIAALNPAPQETAAYALRAAPAGGGVLTPGDTVRGVLLDAQPQHAWAFEVAAPAVVQVTVSAVSGEALPELALLGADGFLVPLVIAGAGQAGTASAVVGESGVYQLIVREVDSTASSAYQLTVRVTSEQDLGAPATTSEAVRERLIATPEPAAGSIQVNPRDAILPAMRPGPDALASAQPVELGTTVRGQIPANAHYQVWRVQVLSGQLVGLTAVGLTHQSAPDLTLLDEQGTDVARSFAPGQPSATLLYRFAATGRAYVVARYEPGGRYLLRIADLSALDLGVRGVLPGQVITLGETLQGELLRPETPVHAYFYAHAGDVIRADVVRPAGAVSLSLETAGGGALANGETDPAMTTRAGLDFRIGNDGLYRLVIQPADDSFVPGTFALHLVLRAGTVNARDGERLESENYGVLDANNPADTWLFAAAAGERVTITAEPANDGALPFSLELTDTAGAPFALRETILGAPALSLDAISLPRSGVYRLIVRAARGESGPYRLRLERDLSSLSDAQHALPLNKTVSRVLTATNTLDVWTFAATEGDVISAEARVAHGDPSQLSFQIRSQSGEVVATVSSDASGRAAAPQILLPSTGHYTLALGNLDAAYRGALAYELAVLLESTQARSMGTLLAPGERGAGELSGADLRDVWLFEGHQGDLARVVVTAEGGGAAASVLTTDWHIASTAGRPETLAVSDRDGAGALMPDPVVLPAEGVYTIDVSTPPGATVRYTVSLRLEPVGSLPAAPIAPGESVEGRLSDTNLREAWTFAGQRGDAASLRVVSDSRATLAPQLSLYGPGGETLAAVQADAQGTAALEDVELPENGVYTFVVTRRFGVLGSTEGRYRAELALEPAPAPATRLLRYGQVGRSWINATSHTEEWVFEGSEGDVIQADVSVLSGTLDPVLRLYGPDGARLAQTGRNAAPSIRTRLLTSGTFRLEVARAAGRYGLTQGNYALSLDRVYSSKPVTAERMLGYGQRVIGTVDNSAPVEVWAFAGAAGDHVRASLRFPTDDTPLALTLMDPAGTALASGVRAGGQARIVDPRLPFSGIYLLEIRQMESSRDAFTPYDLELELGGSEAGAESQGAVLGRGDPVYGRFDARSEVHAWVLRATAGERAVLSLARLEGTLAVHLALLAPDGAVLLEAEPAPAAAALTTEPLVFPQSGLYAVIITGGDGALGLRYQLQFQPLDASPAPPDD